MKLQTSSPAGASAVTKFTRSSLSELDPKIKLRSSLRCDGIGRLDCAEDLESGQRLAVRWLPLEANGEAAVKACERLPQHPMLPRIRQTGKMGSMAFLALDFPEGSLLSTMLGDRLDTGVVLQMASQLADALATVHAQGVVHGEFGSDSVLMVGDTSYLWDMPLVIANRLTDRRGENRLMQNLVRVVPYLAPERARGAGASAESDIYSLGALLCVCAGAPLPAESTTLGTVYAIAQGAWVPRVPSTLPAPYFAMIERMIAADPTARPSAKEVAKLFATPMSSGALPTMPDMPVVRLPPELQARANALMSSASLGASAVAFAPPAPTVPSRLGAKGRVNGSAPAPLAPPVLTDAEGDAAAVQAVASDASVLSAPLFDLGDADEEMKTPVGLITSGEAARADVSEVLAALEREEAAEGDIEQVGAEVLSAAELIGSGEFSADVARVDQAQPAQASAAFVPEPVADLAAPEQIEEVEAEPSAPALMAEPELAGVPPTSLAPPDAPIDAHDELALFAPPKVAGPVGVWPALTVAAPTETSAEGVADAVVSSELEAAGTEAMKSPTVEMPTVHAVADAPHEASAVAARPSIIVPEGGLFSFATEPQKRSMTMWWVAGGAVAAFIGLAVLLVNVVGSSSSPSTAAPAQVAKPVAAPAPVEAAPAMPAAIDEGPGGAPASGQAAPPTPAVEPEAQKLVPAKAHTEELVDVGHEDDLAPLATAKPPRPARLSAAKPKRARGVKPVGPRVAPSLSPAAEVSAPASASGVAPPVAADSAAQVSPASPDDFFEDDDLKQANQAR